jgi:hypothetical protein
MAVVNTVMNIQVRKVRGLSRLAERLLVPQEDYFIELIVDRCITDVKMGGWVCGWADTDIDR